MFHTIDHLRIVITEAKQVLQRHAKREWVWLGNDHFAPGLPAKVGRSSICRGVFLPTHIETLCFAEDKEQKKVATRCRKNPKIFWKYINSKRQIRDHIGDLKTRDKDGNIVTCGMRVCSENRLCLG